MATLRPTRSRRNASPSAILRTVPIPHMQGEVYRGAFYFNAQVRVSESRTAAFVYDTEAVLAGPTDRVLPAEETGWSFPTHADRYGSSAIGDSLTVQGSTFDVSTLRLYLLMQQRWRGDGSKVYVYQLEED